MSHVENLAAHLQKGEALMVTAPHTRRYLTGFPSSDGVVLITPDTAVYMTDFRYIEAAQRAVKSMQARMYKRQSEGVAQFLGDQKIERVYVEASQMPLADAAFWEEKLTGIELVRDKSLDEWMRTERLVKTPAEVQGIRAAQALTDYGFEHILPLIRAGRTEREVALDLEWIIRKQGAEGVAFEFIVVSGANGALPHGVPSDKPIEPGDFITMDFGALLDGWHSDMTRTVAVGKVSDEQRHIYDTVLKAQLAGLASLHEGLPCKDGDAAARDVIDAAGYGEAFGHSTGHGVGVEIHEEPSLAPSAGDTVLQAGNVVTVEPGIYLPGNCGVRIEDMALITHDGHENLTASPKELITL
ncbi:MAG: M24 family metallopeptidase [Acutalibacteraceae bacterium]|jgi:Xaa-Pro aminopeptidase